jgi:hypothetical protein
MHVGIKRLKIDPEAIIGILIIVPLLTVGHYTFKRDMPSYRERLTHGESRTHLFESHIMGRFLPSVEAVMEPEV